MNNWNFQELKETPRICLSNHKGPWVITLQINKARNLIFGIFLLEKMKEP